MDNKGFTLVEVMASFAILLLASQMLTLGVLTARKMEKRAYEIEAAGERMKECILKEENLISGKVHLEMGIDDLTGDGWLYKYEDDNGFAVEAVLLEDGE